MRETPPAKKSLIDRLFLACILLFCVQLALLPFLVPSSHRNTVLAILLPIAMVGLSLGLVWILLGGGGSFRVVGAFLKRGAVVFISYKFQLIFIFLNIGVMIFVFYTVGKPFVQVMMGGMASGLQNYGGEGYDFLSFFLVGMIAWPMLLSGYSIASSRIRQEQFTGMFEIMIPSRYGVKVLPFSYLILGIVGSVINAVITMSVFVFLIGVDFQFSSAESVVGLVSVLLISMLTMWGLGLIFGGLTLIFKQIGPFGSVLQTLMLWFCGVYVPVGILPAWAKPVSYALPLTYSFKAIRAGLISGEGILSYWQDAVVLFAYCIGMIIVGYAVFTMCLNKARKLGTVHGY
ncbi:MAG: hypothetical protein CVT48_02550 [Thermoplasmata archaeon HGW-Thermoplasmata-1]|nr:MAG: hypothetical protein CVT48_02550 [Thermoplasmata archaeon HGW-Thermoplasmata-1]